MKIYYVKHFIPGFKAITLWPFGIISEGRLSPIQLNHEKIHWRQQGALPGIFYVWYLLEWFIKLFIYGGGSYYNISFEREAFDNQDNLEYNKVRWFSYICRVGRSRVG